MSVQIPLNYSEYSGSRLTSAGPQSAVSTVDLVEYGGILTGKEAVENWRDQAGGAGLTGVAGVVLLGGAWGRSWCIRWRSAGMAAAPKVFQFKLVLLGDSAVGKSSLVLRFVRGQFFEYQESTIGGKERQKV